MSANPINEKEIFNTARQIVSPDARVAWLEQACAGHPEQLARIKGLLAAHEQIHSFLEPPSGSQPTRDEPLEERPGTQIGPYKLLEKIGEGGFGIVFMAEQTEPVRRKVALKILKPGMDTRQVVARFEAERQALAIMDHPNIARVFDGGTTASARPYFVMELVKGVPITEFCDQLHLTPRERLELFLPVCQAVQHAHQKGIIHRDLKPSNVLVTRHDTTPIVKVIDFGVAKALGQVLTDKTLFTGINQMVGTPLYMSPEQAGMSDLDIDTRSDIYSLGVLLYELLTGTTPFDKERLKQAAYDEMRRIIREEEPQKPSTRISASGAAVSIAAQRNTDPARLTKLVRGELDWIVMKALEKDRNRRYETANGFAMDVQRYLADEPVQACPPSAGYRLKKFARRNKAALAMASVLAGALVVAVVGLSVSNLLVALERDQKTKALSEKVQALAKESAARTKAQEQEGLAKTSANEAKKQKGIAEGEAARAKEAELLAHRRFYAAQTNLALQAWEAGQPARALELLESLRPKFDQDDLRGFDWYYLWRLCHRNLHRTLNGPTREIVNALAVTPDGTTLLSNCRDESIRVWDVATGKKRALLPGHKTGSWRLAISPDGRMVVSANNDSTMNLWDLGTSELLATLPASSPVRSVAFSSDGKALAAGTEDGELELWDVGERKRRLTLEAHGAPAIALAYSPDGKMLATGAGWNTSRGRGGIKVWDVTSEPPQIVFQAPDGHYAAFAAFSPDSKLLATSHFGVKVWSMPSGELKARFDSPSSNIESVAFSADGNTLVLGCHDRTVKLWEFVTGATRTVGVHLGSVDAVAVVPQSDLLASGSQDGTVKLWHAGPPQDEASFAHKSAIRSLAFTPDSKLLVVGSDTQTKVLDAASGKESTTLTVDGVLATSADANLLVGRAPDDKQVIWDVAEARARAVLPVGPDFAGAAISRDGKTLITWVGLREKTASGGVRLWDLATSRVRVALRLDDDNVYCAAFSPDGKTLATGRQGGAVTLWDPTTGQERMTLLQREGPTMGAFAVAFSTDGNMLAAGNNQGILRLWNVDTGQLKVSFKGHTDAIRSVAFSPDGKTLLSGSTDRSARLWDVVTGQELLSLKDPKFPVHLVAFAPDGKRLATASQNEVKIWLAATEPEATAFRTELDPEDPESPREAINWGTRLLVSHRTQEADNAFRKALGRLEKIATAVPDPPGLGPEFAYFLVVARLITYPPPAAQSHRQFGDIWKTLRADQQSQILVSLNNVGVYYWIAKRLDRSIPIFEEAVRLNRANWPAEANTYRSIAYLGVNYRDAGRLREATPLLEEVVEWARKQPAPDASQFAWATGALVQTYEQDQQFAKAEPFHREALQRAQQQFGAADPRTAGPLATLGSNLLRQQKYTDAEPLVRECLTLREEAEPDAWTTFNARSMLGGCLLGQKKHAEAEPLLLEGYEGMKQREDSIPPAGMPRLCEAIERLAQLYDDWDKPEKSADWRKKLEEEKD